jgi:hypothetical protein
MTVSQARGAQIGSHGRERAREKGGYRRSILTKCMKACDKAGFSLEPTYLLFSLLSSNSTTI